MRAKEILLEQFTACYEENGWFATLENALHGLSAEDALWKKGGVDHSIWELVEHLRYQNERWLKRFSAARWEIQGK